jgi:hypothetical protein
MRRLTCHKKTNYDGDKLLVLTIWEEGAGKETVKKENQYCKTQELLINRGDFYEFVEKKA